MKLMFKSCLTSIFVMVLVSILLVGGLFALISYRASSVDTEIHSIDKYGVYDGNYDNEPVKRYINSFFPAVIEECFEDISYSYKARRIDSWGFEAYLEFVIKDPNEYESYKLRATQGLNCSEFFYDSNFSEYVFHDLIDLANSSESENNTPHISYATIGKILFNDSEHRIIYVALAVFDGGGADVGFLDTYFTRFNIDPEEYEKRLAPNYVYGGGLVPDEE